MKISNIVIILQLQLKKLTVAFPLILSVETGASIVSSVSG